MERDEIRLECIRLAATRTPDHQDALKRAEEFFEFVTEQKASKENLAGPAQASKFVPPKHNGNAKSSR